MPEDKRDIVDLSKLDAAIAGGIADADAGRVQPADKVFRDLRELIARKAEAHGR